MLFSGLLRPSPALSPSAIAALNGEAVDIGTTKIYLDDFKDALEVR